MKAAELDEIDRKVLHAIEPGYDVMIAVLPSAAQVNDFAVALALPKLKKAGWVAFEGRGRFKTCHLTPEGETAYTEAFGAEPE